MSKNTLKFVENLQEMSPCNPVKIAFCSHNNEREYGITAQDAYGNTATLLGIRADGTVVRYSGQEEALKKMGFQTERGFVKMYN